MRTRLANIFAGVRGEPRRWSKVILSTFVLVFLFFVAGGGVSHNARWQISAINILGAQAVDANLVRSAVEEKLQGNYYLVYARSNSYLFSKRDIETGLIQKFLRLAEVEVHKADDHTIVVQVVERKPFALWCGEVYNREVYELNDCWFIDKTGFVFDRAPVFSEGVYPEIYAGLQGGKEGDFLGARILSSRFNFVYEVEQKLAQNIGEPLRASIKDAREYSIVIGKSSTYPILVGAELRFRDDTSADVLVKNLFKAVVAQFPKGASSAKKLLYVDLRFGNKIFFGFEN